MTFNFDALGDPSPEGRARSEAPEGRAPPGDGPAHGPEAAPDESRPRRRALLVGHPDSIAEKILSENEALGGISRMTILLNGGMIPHAKTRHAIELLGTQVAPIVKKELVAVTA